METTITLNEQQVALLLNILEIERIDDNTSQYHNTVVNQIIDKLTNEQL